MSWVKGRSNQQSMTFFDDFEGKTLDLTKWIPVYLPQWSSVEATRPRYRLEQSELVLTIDPDQKPWSPEFNGPIRVSNLQTGVWAGPRGSDRGQHRFSKNLKVRQEQVPQRTYTPLYGRMELRCRCRIGPSNVAALWMIGYEDEPDRSAEICLFELKGTNVGPRSAVVGYGIHPFGDPRLTEAFFEDRFDIDVTEFHVWTVDWAPGSVTFSLDGRPFRSLNQSPGYPMQLMLNLYDLAPADPGSSFVPEFRVDWVRGLEPQKS